MTSSIRWILGADEAARLKAVDEAAKLVLEAWFRSGIRALDPQAEDVLIALSTAVNGVA